MRRAAIVAIVAVFVLVGTAWGQVSFDRGVEEAMLALDTGRVEESAALFERAAEAREDLAERVAPERAWAYVKLGNEALKERDYAGAETYFDKAASIYPGFREMVVEQWAFARLHQTNELISEANESHGEVDWEALEESTKWVVEAAPQNRQAYYTLGLIYDFQDKKEDAKKYYVQALGRRNAGRNRSLAALRKVANEAVSGTTYTFDLRPIYPPWKHYEAGDWKVIRRGPFTIYHRNEELAGRVGAVLEYWLERPALGGVLTGGGEFPEECEVYIFPDEESFKSSGGKEIWAGGQSKFTYRDDKLMTATIQLYQTAPELTEGAVPHELAHVRFLAAAPYLEGMPLWLQEGVATSTETDYKKGSLAGALSAAYASGGLMPFEQVMEAQTYPQDYASELFYGECVAAVEKLVEKYGQRRFRQYVKGAKSLGGFKALRAVYGLSARQVEDLIVEWADQRQ